MEKQLLVSILEKRDELNELMNQYDRELEVEKKAKLKVGGFDRVLYLLAFDFESSCERTPQYREFHRIFRTEFTRLLKPHISEIKISPPNHFDVYGFFETNEGQIFCFSIGDLRWDKELMMIRTAKDFNDHNGGSNNFITIDKDFPEKIIRAIKTIKL